jgi:hypothetical protein
MAFYGSGEMMDGSHVPEAAVQLVEKIASYCQPAHGDDPATGFVPEETEPEELPPPRVDGFSAADVVRPQLADAASRLSKRLDMQWTRYLQIPPEIFQGGPHPSPAAVHRCLMRLDNVAQDPQYAVLTQREDFQQMRTLLREYERVLIPPETAQRIPPPPVVVEAEPVLRR